MTPAFGFTWKRRVSRTGPLSSRILDVFIGLVALWVTSQTLRADYQIVKSFGFGAQSTGSDPLACVIQASDGRLYGTTSSGGAYNEGVVYGANPDGSGYLVLHSFGGASRGDGRAPRAEVCEAANGVLYGVSYFGGSNDLGCIFRVAKDGSGYQVLHSFSTSDGVEPVGGLLAASDGYIYGTTSFGGTNNFGGTIFRIGVDGSAFTVLRNVALADGTQSQASLIEGVDGGLYGTALNGGPGGKGTVFRMNKDGSNFSVLTAFTGNSGDGSSPSGTLLQLASGGLVGTTRAGGSLGPNAPLGNGTIFSVATNGGVAQILYAFPADGSNGLTPQGRIVADSNGFFYGVCFAGGNSGDMGCAYKFAAQSLTLSIVRFFSSDVPGILGNVNEGGAQPLGIILGSDGATLYGTTSTGGASGNGVIFKVNTSGLDFLSIHDFLAPAVGDGVNPQATLLLGADGRFYGTTYQGGTNGLGAVFSVNWDGSGYAVLHSFIGGSGDGGYPQAGLVQGSDGTLYGVCSSFGVNSLGVVFKLQVDGSHYQVLHNFQGQVSDGASPQSRLIFGQDGSLYGTTRSGGTFNEGTVYGVNSDGGDYRVLYNFGGPSADGTRPVTPVQQGPDGLLYGTTQTGGIYGAGTVYVLATDGSGYRVLYQFVGSGGDGLYPKSGLTLASDGLFYGTTFAGGLIGFGSVYSIDTNGTYNQLYSFAGPPTDGCAPQGELLEGADGAIYGTTTSGGTFSLGTVYRLLKQATLYSLLHSFSNASGDGSTPDGGLAQGVDGSILGTTFSGGDMGFGEIFRITDAAEEPLVISSESLTDRGLVMEVNGGVPGLGYNVLFTATLTSPVVWTTLGAGIADTNGHFEYIDGSATNSVMGFYKISTQ